ncbi:hypothetical protein TrVE_jg5196 [Triparma verrucosa]|uniref:NADH dehydrogenase [ubiquinone] 1 beta subcomplex subunit 11, mitochondrial n=1 Tax=Triparma verrucosa TaxID=1606542 RepID=A0A9W6ZCC2_9STRA|nr:hypothetical protein TrVE_jg5196 [Triparma verrucosa]
MLSNTSIIARRTLPAVRRFGAGQPESASMKGKLWGSGIDGKGGGRYNGWESIIYPTYAAATLILVFGVGFAPDTSIKTWANGEARARLNLKDMGEDVEGMGVHYNVDERRFRFEFEEIDQVGTTEYKDNYSRDRN